MWDKDSPPLDAGRTADGRGRRRPRTSKWRYDSPRSGVRSEPASARTPAPRSGDRRPSDARVRLRLFGVDAADVVLFPRGPAVISFVVPEVEVTPSVELTDPGPASDFHFHTSK